MPVLTGYSSSFLTRAALDCMVLYINGTTAFAAGPGDLAFDPADEWQNIAEDVDGVLQPIVGADRKIAGIPKFTGTIWEADPTFFDEFIPDQTQSGTDPVLVTPPVIGGLVPSNKYLTNVRGVCQLAGGTNKYMVIKVANAICTKWDFKGARKGHAGFSIEISGRAADASGASLYTVDFRSAVGGPS